MDIEASALGAGIPTPRYWAELGAENNVRKYSNILVDTLKGIKEFKAQAHEYLRYSCAGKSVSIERIIKDIFTGGYAVYQIAYFPEVVSVEATPIL